MESDCNREYGVLQGQGYYNILQSIGLYWGLLGGRGYRNQAELFIFNKNIKVESEALLSICSLKFCTIFMDKKKLV